MVVQLIADRVFYLESTFPSQISDKQKVLCAHPDNVLYCIKSCTFEIVERSYGKIQFFKDHIRCVFRSTSPHGCTGFGQTAPDFVRPLFIGKAPQKDRCAICQSLCLRCGDMETPSEIEDERISFFARTQQPKQIRGAGDFRLFALDAAFFSDCSQTPKRFLMLFCSIWYFSFALGYTFPQYGQRAGMYLLSVTGKSLRQEELVHLFLMSLFAAVFCTAF